MSMNRKECLVEKLAGMMLAMYGDSDIRVTREDLKKQLRKHNEETLRESLQVLEGKSA